MRLLELFSGTGSVGTPWREAGHEVIAVDLDGRYNPEIVCDILQWSNCKSEVPDVIWASVPCEQYSRARTTARRPRNFKLADSLAGRAWEIIQYFLKLNPDMLWFIENPDSSLLWGRDVAAEFTPQVRLDYCQYGGPGYRTRTRMATNAVWVPRPLCDPKTCPQCTDGRHVLTAQRGPGRKCGVRMRSSEDRCSLDQLHGLPRELTEEILRVSEAHQWEIVGPNALG